MRDAITQANLTLGSDTIHFDIPTPIGNVSPVRKIKLGTSLPSISSPITIDGTTQPGFSGVPVIELDGSQAGIGVHGLWLTADGNSIKGLSIIGFKGSGIRVDTSDGNTIVSNYLGVSSDTGQSVGNGDSGIYIENGSNNIIGGTQGATGSLGNVISGNLGDGIAIVGPDATDNRIWSNLIGVTPSGSAAQPNSGDGIAISQARNTRIGGESSEQANVISGNANNGISLSHRASVGTVIRGNWVGVNGRSSSSGSGSLPKGSIAIPNGGAGIAIVGADEAIIGGLGSGSGNIISGNRGAGIDFRGGDRSVVLGNTIGADASGTKNIGNQGSGISINGSNEIHIGGATAGVGNLIAWNGAAFGSGGIHIASGSRNTILSNSIFDNDGLGIGLFSVSSLPLPNDDDDLDGGPNDLQNYPVLEMAATAADQTLLRGTLESKPNAHYTLQFFSNRSLDPTGHGEGQRYLGQTSVLTDAQGKAVVDLILNAGAAVGEFLSATATDELGNTSGFSMTTLIARANQSNLSIDIAPQPSVILGSDFNYTIKVTNTGPDTATNINFSMDIESGLAFLGSSLAQIVSTIPGRITGNLGEIAASSSLVFTITVRAEVAGPFSTTAGVTLDELDADLADNTETEVTLVALPVDLGLTLSSETPAAIVGQEMTLLAMVANHLREDLDIGPATDTVLELVLPQGASFVEVAMGRKGSVSLTGHTLRVNLGTLLPSESVAVRITLVSPAEIPPGGELPFSASVFSLEKEVPGSDPNSNVASIAVPLLPASDLAVTASSNPDPVAAGSPLTYTFVVTNFGPSDATNVVLLDPLPIGVIYGSAVASQGTVDQTDGVVTARFGTLPSGATATFTIVVTPRFSQLLANVVSVSGDTIDVEPDNNALTVLTKVSPADLAVQVSASPSPVVVGEPVTLVGVVTNNGPFSATGVELTSVLPGGFDLLSATTTSGSTSLSNSGIIVVTVGDLASGATATVVIVGVPRNGGTVTFETSVIGDLMDPDPANNVAKTTATVIDPPGVLNFVAESFSASESAGTVVVTITRTRGSSGSASVNYATGMGTAVAGTNFTPVTGTARFGPGEVSTTFAIPVRADGVLRGDVTVAVFLSSPSAGSVLGSMSTAILVIQESDRDRTGPIVTRVINRGEGRAMTGVSLVFDEPLDPIHASDPANYAIYVSRNRRGEVLLPIGSTTYDPATQTVTVIAADRMVMNTFYRIVLNGTSPSGVQDVHGNLVRGDRTSNGLDFSASFARGKTLTYADRDGDTVSIRLTRGGLADLTRDSSGEGLELRIQTRNNRRSILTGNVRRRSVFSDGVSSFQSIVGAGFGGRIDSRLTTPNFFVEGVSALLGRRTGGASMQSSRWLTPRSLVGARSLLRGPGSGLRG